MSLGLSLAPPACREAQERPQCCESPVNTLPLGRSYYSQPSLLVSVALLEVIINTLLKRQGDSCHAYSKTLLTP